MAERRDRPSQHGAILGDALADLAKAGRSGIPDFPEMCAGCAFRPGAMANQMAATVKNALDCILDDAATSAFCCHHGMKDGEPTKICAGYLAAARAPWPVFKAAMHTVGARLAAIPEHDPIRAEFDEWIAGVDPEGKLNDYQRARLFALRPPMPSPTNTIGVAG